MKNLLIIIASGLILSSCGLSRSATSTYKIVGVVDSVNNEKIVSRVLFPELTGGKHRLYKGNYIHFAIREANKRKREEAKRQTASN